MEISDEILQENMQVADEAQGYIATVRRPYLTWFQRTIRWNERVSFGGSLTLGFLILIAGMFVISSATGLLGVSLALAGTLVGVAVPRWVFNWRQRSAFKSGLVKASPAGSVILEHTTLQYHRLKQSCDAGTMSTVTAQTQNVFDLAATEGQLSHELNNLLGIDEASNQTLTRFRAPLSAAEKVTRSRADSIPAPFEVTTTALRGAQRELFDTIEETRRGVVQEMLKTSLLLEALADEKESTAESLEGLLARPDTALLLQQVEETLLQTTDRRSLHEELDESKERSHAYQKLREKP